MVYWKSLHSALTQKGQISDTRAAVWCADCLYTPYSFEFCMRDKKERRRTAKLRFSQQIFLTVSIFYFRIAKGFHLWEFCITLLWLSWSCSFTLCTGCHLEPAHSQVMKFYCISWFVSGYSASFLELTSTNTCKSDTEAEIPKWCRIFLIHCCTVSKHKAWGFCRWIWGILNCLDTDSWCAPIAWGILWEYE